MGKVGRWTAGLTVPGVFFSTGKTSEKIESGTRTSEKSTGPTDGAHERAEPALQRLASMRVHHGIGCLMRIGNAAANMCRTRSVSSMGKLP